jgi:multisubunit Na+/H+ antiporter MnhC subunit
MRSGGATALTYLVNGAMMPKVIVEREDARYRSGCQCEYKYACMRATVADAAHTYDTTRCDPAPAAVMLTAYVCGNAAMLASHY